MFCNFNFKQTNKALETGGQEHGALVQQIIETQKELETAQKPQEKKVEIVSQYSFIRHFLILYVL